MGHNVPADGLLGVRVEHGAGSIDGGDHLVRDDHGDSVLIGELHEGTKEPGKVHLTRSELTSAGVIRTVEGGGTVHDKEGVPRLAHHGARLDQKLALMVAVVGPRVCHIVKHIAAVQTVPRCNGKEPFGTERSFRVNVKRLRRNMV